MKFTNKAQKFNMTLTVFLQFHLIRYTSKNTWRVRIIDDVIKIKPYITGIKILYS